MFDTYTLKARVYPIVIILLPLILTGFIVSIEFTSLYPLGASALLTGALSYLFSQLGRDMGKRKEAKLWSKCGGTPSVQLLRLSDGRIDKHTKLIYHQKLSKLCNTTEVPTKQLEEVNFNEADQIYISWSRYLIAQTRDTKVFNLLFKENCNYGFRRNLWGMKPFALSIIFTLILGSYSVGYYSTNSINPLLFNLSLQCIILCLIFLSLFWVFIVTRNWVKIVAFSYAERLCEASRSL